MAAEENYMILLSWEFGSRISCVSFRNVKEEEGCRSLTHFSAFFNCSRICKKSSAAVYSHKNSWGKQIVSHGLHFLLNLAQFSMNKNRLETYLVLQKQLIEFRNKRLHCKKNFPLLVKYFKTCLMCIKSNLREFIDM